MDSLWLVINHCMAIKEGPWLNTSDTETYLNISRKCLYNKKDVDRFKLGIHYRVIDPKAERLTYQWNVHAIESLMESAIDDLLVASQTNSLNLSIA